MSEKSTKTGFTAVERDAMKERAAELRAEKKAGAAAEKGARDVLEKIAEMPAGEQRIAKGIHELITAEIPALTPKTWYGMPAWARDGKIVVFFQAAAKFDSRYSTLGFQDPAQLDDGAFWPTSFAVTEWNEDVAARVRELVARAVG
jgi:uncharacterized protein YdhG (YjbR/CyaY superfamily)